MASTRNVGPVLMDPGGTPGSAFIRILKATFVVGYAFVIEGKYAGDVANCVAYTITGTCLNRQGVLKAGVHFRHITIY